MDCGKRDLREASRYREQPGAGQVVPRSLRTHLTLYQNETTTFGRFFIEKDTLSVELNESPFLGRLGLGFLDVDLLLRKS